MEAKSTQKFIRMPARKMRRVINEIRGKNASEALTLLKFMPYFAAAVVEKNLACAVANAQIKYGVGPESLVVSEAFADEGPTYKRVRPRAQGRMYKILRRTSHITVKVSIVENKKVKAK